jgi:hypothetical protein
MSEKFESIGPRLHRDPESAVPANFPAVPSAAPDFHQPLELAIIMAGEAAADAARLANSAVFASGSGP